MAKLTPQEAADKLITRLKSAGNDIKRGIENMTENPLAKAAAKKENWMQGLQKAYNEGKWERGLSKVDFAAWKKKIIEVGIPRIAAGIEAARPKVESFFSEVLPHIDRGMAELNNLPDLTIEDSINRAAYWIRHMASFKRSK